MALAAALTLAGFFGAAADSSQSQADQADQTEEVAATWSFTADPGGDKGWSGTNGATWS